MAEWVGSRCTEQREPATLGIGKHPNTKLSSPHISARLAQSSAALNATCHATAARATIRSPPVAPAQAGRSCCIGTCRERLRIVLSPKRDARPLGHRPVGRAALNAEAVPRGNAHKSTSRNPKASRPIPPRKPQRAAPRKPRTQATDKPPRQPPLVPLQNPSQSRSGGTGRRGGLKIRCPKKTCRFDPDLRHRRKDARSRDERIVN
jgi:hypothetical protein